MAKSRFGSPGDIARLDIHGWDGRLIDRIKAKSGEKNNGAMLIDKAKNFFGLNNEEVERRLQEIRSKELEEQKLFTNLRKDKPIVWKRDSRGNIV
jgi:hypothetical protein